MENEHRQPGGNGWFWFWVAVVVVVCLVGVENIEMGIGGAMAAVGVRLMARGGKS